jgi:hypothetical protein
MFRIAQDPSSGSDNLYLTEVTYSGSYVLIMCVDGLLAACCGPVVCVCVCVCTLRRTEKYWCAVVLDGVEVQ